MKLSGLQSSHTTACERMQVGVCYFHSRLNAERMHPLKVPENSKEKTIKKYNYLQKKINLLKPDHFYLDLLILLAVSSTAHIKNERKPLVEYKLYFH